METQRRERRHAILFAIFAGVFLAGGWLLRPRDIPELPPPVPSESELQELARLTQRRSLEGVTTYFADLATDLSSPLVYLQSAHSTGVAWNDSRIVTGPVPEGPVVLREGAEDSSVEALSSRRVPITVLPSDALRPARRAPLPPAPGDWMLVVWQTATGRAFAATNFRQVSDARCGSIPVQETVSTMSFNDAMIGGALFNMDRELLAVLLPCGDHVAAVEPSSVDELIARAMAIEERILTRYGLLLEPSAVEDAHADDGLFVKEVWNGTKADVAEVMPGDVLISVNQQPVSKMDDLQLLAATPGPPPELQFRQGSKMRRVVFDDGTAAGAADGNDSKKRVTVAGIAPFHIDAVDSQSAAAVAGVRSGDDLLRIDHVPPRTRLQVERALNGSRVKSTLLEIQRDERRLAIVIPQSAPRE